MYLPSHLTAEVRTRAEVGTNTYPQLSYPWYSLWQPCLDIVLFGVMVRMLYGVASFLDPTLGFEDPKGLRILFCSEGRLTSLLRNYRAACVP